MWLDGTVVHRWYGYIHMQCCIAWHCIALLLLGLAASAPQC